jgi:thioredoxin-related protein
MLNLFVAACMFLTPGKTIWLHDLDAAKETAKKEHKLILLNFSGSDWCIPCIRMHDEVLNNETFLNYASENLVLVNADFPRKSKNQLSKAQQALNDKLAEQYNNNGAFPYTILLDSDGNKLKVWDGYYKNGANSFIDDIKAIQIK